MTLSIKRVFIYLLHIVGLALLNYIGASLGKLLAIPPGNVTPVWPPSGIAFSALLLLGYQYWPGVWIGSFLFNSLFFYQKFHFLSPTLLLCCAIIASGSTIQAFVGAYTSKKLIGFQNAKFEHEVFLKSLIIGGPLACIIAATLGTFSLTILKAINYNDYLTTWITWWFGDSAGVIVISGGLIYCFYQLQTKQSLTWASTKKYFHPIVSAMLIIIMLGSTLWGWSLLKMQTETEDNMHFESQVKETESAIRTQLLSYEDALNGALGFIKASDHINHLKWNSYIKSLNIKNRYPGILGIGYITYINKENTSQSLKNISNNTSPEFKIHPVPYTKDTNLFVIQFIEPFETNRAALGYDIASEPKRRQAAELSRDTGISIITAPIELVQDQEKNPGFLLLLPVYHGNSSITTVTERRKALQGWVYAPFVGKHIFQSILTTTKPEISFKIYDSKVGPENYIYGSSSPENRHSITLFTRIHQFHYAGRDWQIVWESTPYFKKSKTSNQSGYILLIGLLSSLFLSTLLVNLHTTRYRAFKIAEKVTQEIKVANQTLEYELQERKRIEKLTHEISHRNEMILNAISEGIFGFDSNLTQ